MRKKVLPIVAAMGLFVASCQEVKQDHRYSSEEIATLTRNAIEAADNVRLHLRKDSLSLEDVDMIRNEAGRVLGNTEVVQSLPSGITVVFIDTVKIAATIASEVHAIEDLREHYNKSPSEPLRKAALEAVKNAYRTVHKYQKDFQALTTVLYQEATKLGEDIGV